MNVFCDFDGTITIEDATDFILSRFALPEWEQIEIEWQKGIIGSAECMQRQVALIHATRQELNAALDQVHIDHSFPSFVDFCSKEGMPVTVISDGVDYFIERILARHGLEYLPVIASRLTISGLNGHTSYRLDSPYSDAACASAAGVCKCRAVQSSDIRQSSDICIYVGDGRSDFCVSDKTDLVFAKGRLAEYCEEQKIPFILFEQFSDVTKALRAELPRLVNRKPEKTVYAFA